MSEKGGLGDDHVTHHSTSGHTSIYPLTCYHDLQHFFHNKIVDGIFVHRPLSYFEHGTSTGLSDHMSSLEVG